MKKIGIALGGGGAKGLSHILMLEFYKADEIFKQVQSARDQLKMELEKVLK
jgi:hypothetical protein